MVSRSPAPQAPALRGFTLVEMLVVVTLLAALAGVVVPSLSSLNDHRLDVAAIEVRDALRFARSEAMRRGQPTLVDAETAPGKIKVLALSSGSPLVPATCNSYSASNTVADPRTKSAFVIDITGGTFSGGVVVTPRFLVSGTAYAGLIFNAHGVPSDVCQIAGTNSKGAPAAGSNVVLTLGNRQTTVSLDTGTGRVSTP